MALGATFWSTGGAAALWHDMDTFVSGYISAGPDGNGMRPLWTGPCKIYQEPVAVGGRESRVQNNPGINSGYFYAVETTTGEIIWCDAFFPVGFPHALTGNVGQWQFLVPSVKSGKDLVPATTSGTNNGYYDKNPIYKTGFLHNLDLSKPPRVEAGTNIAIKIFVDEKVGTWRLHHYNPYAWHGTPPEVVAAAAMHAGLDSDFIDQDAFDAAHDAYDLSTGDAPWTGLDDKWEIFARRTVGQKVSDFLLKCVGHGRDLIFVSESGKLSCASMTRPTLGSGFTLAADGVLDVLSWTDTLRHTFNTIKCGWGSAGRQSWEDTNGYLGGPGSDEQAVVYEPNLETRPADKWEDNAQDAGSVAAYGELWLKGHKTLVNYTGHPEEVEITHFPFLLSPHVSLADATGFTWDKATDGGGMLHVTYWITSDAKPRAEIEIRQGAIGFDIGVGDGLENVALTGDGRTLSAWVIERSYNFDDMKMDSTLLEIP